MQRKLHEIWMDANWMDALSRATSRVHGHHSTAEAEGVAEPEEEAAVVEKYVGITKGASVHVSIAAFPMEMTAVAVAAVTGEMELSSGNDVLEEAALNSVCSAQTVVLAYWGPH